MSSGVSQGSEGNNSVAEFEPTVDNGDQLTDCQMPPDTLVGEPQWRLQRWFESPTSPGNNQGGIITKEEEYLIETLIAQENDGLYFTKSGQEGDSLVRLYCQTPECNVKAKVVRWHGKLCLYTQHVHQNHLITPQKGLKKPALRLVEDNRDKTQAQLLQDLKQRDYHNKSWSDRKNIVAIKNAKLMIKKNAQENMVDKQDAFANLQELGRALSARHQSIQDFLSSIDPPCAITAGAQSTNKRISPLRNIIVLHHDVGTRNNGLDDDWSEIVVTVPSARAALQKAPSLWGTGHVQQEADYSQGFWVGNLRQLGMVGISDADRKFHTTVLTIQKSENALGSTTMLSKSTEMLMKSSAVPESCLKDGSEALSRACKSLRLIENDCFAHMVRLPFTRGGGIRGSRGSLSRYLLKYTDDHGKTQYTLSDVFDVLSFFFAFSHLTTVQDWVTARNLFMKKKCRPSDSHLQAVLAHLPTVGLCMSPTSGEQINSRVRENLGLPQESKDLSSKKKCHRRSRVHTGSNIPARGPAPKRLHIYH
jgi:hypothetical protein